MTITALTTTTAAQTDGVVVRSAVKAGRLSLNHAEGVVVRSAVKAGRLSLNHAEGVIDPKPAPAAPESAKFDGVISHEAGGDERVREPGSASPRTTGPADEDGLVIEN
jgi:hypothetical protein